MILPSARLLWLAAALLAGALPASVYGEQDVWFVAAALIAAAAMVDAAMAARLPAPALSRLWWLASLGSSSDSRRISARSSLTVPTHSGQVWGCTSSQWFQQRPTQQWRCSQGSPWWSTR